MRTLRGKKGTRVKLGVQRNHAQKLVDFIVTRGEVPNRSVEASYKIGRDIGYIKVRSFTRTTYNEFITAIAKEKKQGCTKFIVDLRDNAGGLMDAAVNMINEFIPAGQMIVYVQGKAYPRQEFFADGRGTCQDAPLVVLTDEMSGSASEIFAGAIQDNDRGTIIGRRSFGKGLVQQQIQFPDGSMIRLTIARYYTPSGRCIQKPFKPGGIAAYEQDMLTRYQHGEFFYQDSIKHTGPAYHTGNGRIVYGGGGITPDIFIPEDTTDVTSYYKEAVMRGLLLQYAFKYTDENRQTLNKYTEMKTLAAYLRSKKLVNGFVNFAEKNGLQRRNNLIRKSHSLLEKYIHSRIIYNMLDEQAWNEYLNNDDDMIKMAVKVLDSGKAFPKAPAKKYRQQKKNRTN